MVLERADDTFARRAGDPQVGGPGVEVDQEGLCGGTDRDGARPFGILVLVCEGLALTPVNRGEVRSGDDDGFEDLSALREGTRVTLKIDQVAAVLAVNIRNKSV